MKRIIVTYDGYIGSPTAMTFKEAEQQVRKDYPGIDWKYWGWSSHNEHFVFDAKVGDDQVPDGLTGYDIKPPDVVKAAQEKSLREYVCLDCGYVKIFCKCAQGNEHE